MMLMPRKKEMDLFDEMFSDPFFSMKESRLMKTDIKEIDDGYEIEVDLPGKNILKTLILNNKKRKRNIFTKKDI